jgi:hypothetical protein
MQRKFIIKESNLTEKPQKVICLVRVTVIARDNTPFFGKSCFCQFWSYDRTFPRERQDRFELTTFILRDHRFTPELVRHNFRQSYFDLERFINARLVAVSNVPNHIQEI